jgi:hypothetical protein
VVHNVIYRRRNLLEFLFNLLGVGLCLRFGVGRDEMLKFWDLRFTCTGTWWCVASIATFNPDVTGVEVSESEESDSEESPVYQRHWFSALMESGLTCERESRLGQTRAELRRKVIQIWRGMPLPPLGPHGRNQHSNVLLEALLDSARRHPSQAALFVRSSEHGKGCHSHMRNNRLVCFCGKCARTVDWYAFVAKCARTVGWYAFVASVLGQ